MDNLIKVSSTKKIKKVKADKIKTVKAKAKASQQQKQTVNIRIGTDQPKKKRKPSQRTKKAAADGPAPPTIIYTPMPIYRESYASSVSSSVSNIDKELDALRKELASLKPTSRFLGTTVVPPPSVSVAPNVPSPLVDYLANTGIPVKPSPPSIDELLDIPTLLPSQQNSQLADAMSIVAAPAEQEKKRRGRPRKSETQKLKESKGPLSSVSEGDEGYVSGRTRTAKSKKKEAATIEQLAEMERRRIEEGYSPDVSTVVSSRKSPLYLGSPPVDMPPIEENDFGKSMLFRISTSPENVAARKSIYQALNIFQDKQSSQ
jgi:hypothetical protein